MPPRPEASCTGLPRRTSHVEFRVDRTSTPPLPPALSKVNEALKKTDFEKLKIWVINIGVWAYLIWRYGADFWHKILS